MTNPCNMAALLRSVPRITSVRVEPEEDEPGETRLMIGRICHEAADQIEVMASVGIRQETELTQLRGNLSLAEEGLANYAQELARRDLAIARLRDEVRALRIGHGFANPDSLDPPAHEPSVQLREVSVGGAKLMVAVEDEPLRQALRRKARMAVCPKCEQDPYDGHDMCTGAAVKSGVGAECLNEVAPYLGPPCNTVKSGEHS